MSHYLIGLDFGTGSARALVVEVLSGAALATAEVEIDTVTSASNPDLARQRPDQYLDALETSIRKALANALDESATFSPADVIGIGVDATGSTPLPVNDKNVALGCLPAYADNLNAQAWLWKDHTAAREAKAITQSAAAAPESFLESCGGAYSSEWFWAKIWHCLNVDREIFEAAHSWVECCDWLASQLVGVADPSLIRRGACAAGHKALFSDKWGGLPPADFLSTLAPELRELRSRLFSEVYPIGAVAGTLSESWALRTGLSAGIPVSVANLDAHAGAVGAGVGEGQLVKIMGTSTCDCALLPHGDSPVVSGISGIAADSIVPGYYGVEAGQSAVGDIFDWFVDMICLGDDDLHRDLSEEMASLAPGASGLIALDWHNGNRCVLADAELTGHVFGMTLHTTRAELYRAWIEATAFGARVILDTLRAAEISTDTIVCCGGIAVKNPALMQIYADITKCHLVVCDSDQTCALGSAVAAGVASGVYRDVQQAQQVLAAKPARTFTPDAGAVAVYDRMYEVYLDLHDVFGRGKQMDIRSPLAALRQLAAEARAA